MRQPLPHQGFPEKDLLWLLENNPQLMIVTANISLFGLLRVGIGSDPRFLDANPQTITCSSVCISKTARGKVAVVDIEEVVREYM